MRRSPVAALLGLALACAGCAAVLGVEDLVDDEHGSDASDGAAGYTDDGGLNEALRFCERQDATFCADFDEPNDAGLDGFTPALGGGGRIHLGASDASAPSAFVATSLPIGDGKASASAPVGTFRTRIDVAATIRIDVAPNNGNVNLLDLGGTAFFLHVHGNGATVTTTPWYARSLDNQHEIGAPCTVELPLGIWTRVELTVETPDTVTFRTDGVERCRVDLATDAGIVPNVGAAIDLGFGFTQDAAAQTAADDVTVTIR